MVKKVSFIVLMIMFWGCLNEKQQAEKILRHYIEQKEELIRNYSKESAVALWNATVSGNEVDYQKLIDLDFAFTKSNQNAPDHFSPDQFFSISKNVFTNEQDFQLLKKLKKSDLITDTLLHRQLNVLYQAFMGSQIETEKYQQLIFTEIKLWQVFTTLKLEIDGKKYRIHQLDSLRKKAVNDEIFKQIFYAYQKQGQLLAPDIIRMVKERNSFAANFGYSDYYHLLLDVKDQNPDRIALLLDEIEQKTRNPFFEAKAIIDQMLAKRFHISESGLRPWHYNEDRASYLPKRFTMQMDSLFTGIDPIKKAAQFFEGIGLPIQDVIDNSDLKYHPQKSSATSMINIDFKNDIRLISSVQKTHEGMSRMMHLGGHASHYKSISDDVPYLLKTPSLIIGEGIAGFFESLATNVDWLKDEVAMDNQQQNVYVVVCRHLQQVDRLFRCRKLSVMANFEREIYRNPEQNLDSLWQQLNLKYLGIHFIDKENSGFWAANKFNTSLSCTIHNSILADVFSVQLQHAIKNRVLRETNGVYSRNKAVGRYLVENLYRYGNQLSWEQLIVKATGEPLNPDYFVSQLTDD